MKATRTLKHEHDVIRKALEVLDAFAARVAAGGAPPGGDVAGLLEFFTVFADGCHHVKEERILFPALEAAGLRRGEGPVGVLLDQHREGRRLVGILVRQLPGLGTDAAARRRFADAARAYAAMLEEHIAVENDVLFPDADGLLTEERDREIAAAFDRHEEEEMGAGVHQRFHRMLDELARRYLDPNP
jgi:hemerythrin-like domain-containing protein